MPRFDFSFVDEDIERQRRLARFALEKAKELDDQIGKAGDEAARQALVAARRGFLDIARRLAESANTTSLTASSVMSSVSAARSN